MFYCHDTLFYKSTNIKTLVDSWSYNNHMLGSTMFNIFIMLKVIILEWGADNEAEWYKIGRASLCLEEEDGN